MARIHTIPVPPGWSPEQAWEAIKREDDLPEEEDPSWINVETDDQDRFVRFIYKDEE